ncbi:hypothetical protein NQ314_008866 [Rhamnusium bicolor]|uniref:URB1 C-terminal domain-containing protein n=1 Tax=Rhamnusium bicolor TaxID=1586634 RepID=A0AAV8Y6K7_9CUCU|nr:hypothetical protein NQ314_008866 [Rhamnusium bicolor]
MLKEFVEKYEVLPANIKEYCSSWTDNKEIAFVKKSKGRFDVFRGFSESFLSENFGNFLTSTDLNLYEDLPLNLLQASIFYISNLLINGNLTLHIVENCEKFAKYLIEKNILNDAYIQTILGHPILLYNVSFLNLDKAKAQSFSTKLLLTVISELLSSGFYIEGYLNVYREKLLSTTLRILKKPQKYYNLSSFVEILQLFNLSYDQCCKVLANLSDFVNRNNEFVPIIVDVLNYCLEQISCLCDRDSNLKPLEECIVKKLTTYFVVLNKKQDVNVSGLSVSFLKYLQVFPHNIKNLDKELFGSILNLNEYNKDNVNLAVFLLERNTQLVESIKDKLDSICEKKGVILPLLQILVDTNVDESILKQIFENFEASLNKALQKPQKSGQHFHHNYKGLLVLVEKYMPLEKCKLFLEKVHKFEVAEVFHAKLLQAICNKVIDSDVTSKLVNNIIMIFVHLQMVLFKRKTKSDDDTLKLKEIAATFNDVLCKLQPKIGDKEFKSTAQNESLKLYFKFGLKFGISGQPILLKVLTSLINALANSIDIEDSKLILDMLLSHSEFLDNVLGEHSEGKLEILYEASASQTSFYDFKPFLWGKAAASHYSVRLNIENSLLRQPKTGDVLDILQDDYIRSTIVNYPVKESLNLSDAEILGTKDEKCYDIKFMLPLFSQLLASEQQVQTYKFTRSGALSLTIVALSSQDKEVRQAASHILSRFHFHVEARQTGKDNLLWIRYVEAVCKGTAMLPDFKLNNFSAIYLARMALILTQPNHVMYIPLSQHLTAKSSLDFSTVPELYTFLHSST